MNVVTMGYRILCIRIALSLAATLLHASSVMGADGASRFAFSPRFYYVEESYFDIINRQAKEKYWARNRAKKRHIGFWGKLGEYERSGGVKVVIPF